MENHITMNIEDIPSPYEPLEVWVNYQDGQYMILIETYYVLMSYFEHIDPIGIIHLEEEGGTMLTPNLGDRPFIAHMACQTQIVGFAPTSAPPLPILTHEDITFSFKKTIIYYASKESLCR